jgi:eukaryotic-like serine/threonine-protein kinase
MASYPRAIARASSSLDATIDEGQRVADRIADRYTPREQIGTGGMGVVIAAWDEQANREVALKLLQPTRDDELSVQRFFREARTTEKLKSHFVVRILDVGIDGDRPYIAMERLSGEDLAARLKRAGPLPAQDAVDFAIQACDALAHAHAAGIVHRDIKPSNMFQQINPDGTTYIKVLDFGISKSMSREEWETTLTVTGEGGLLGSPAYMSPEQIRSASKVDHRSDFWSLGIVLYKLMSGRQPFDGESVGEIFVRILERTYPSFTQLNMAIPKGVEIAIGKALQQDRSRRFRNAGEFAQALAPFASPRGKILAEQISAYCAQFPPAFTIDDNESSMPSLPAFEHTAGLPVGPSPWSAQFPQSQGTGSAIVVPVQAFHKHMAIGFGIFAGAVLVVLGLVLARDRKPETETPVPPPEVEIRVPSPPVSVIAPAVPETTTTPVPTTSAKPKPSASSGGKHAPRGGTGNSAAKPPNGGLHPPEW